MLEVTSNEAELWTKVVLGAGLAIGAIWWGWFRKDTRNPGPKPGALKPPDKRNNQ